MPEVSSNFLERRVRTAGPARVNQGFTMIPTCVVLVLLVLERRAPAQSNNGLLLQLHLLRHSAQIGTSIELDLEFVNDGTSEMVLRRTWDLGPADIDFVARRGECTYRVQPLHYDMLTSDWERSFTRLFPGDRLFQAVTLNDPQSISGQLVFPQPGSYTLQASFRSTEPSSASDQGPVWRGTVHSPEIVIRIDEPSPSRLETGRERLRSALEGKELDLTTLRYFDFVRDTVAADLLVALLRKNPDDPLLVDAVAHQGRSADAEALEEAANELSGRDPR